MGTDNLFTTGFDFGGSVDDDGVYSYRLTGLASRADAQKERNKEKLQNEPQTGYYGWLPRQGTVVRITRADGSEYKLPHF